MNDYANLVVAACALGVVLLFCALPFFMMAALAFKYRVSFLSVLGMKLRKVPPKSVLPIYAEARERGIDVDLGHLETHFLAGGHIERIVAAMVLAREKGWRVKYETFARLDLVGEDPVARCKDARSPADLELKPS